MGWTGRFVERFEDGNLAQAGNVHLDCQPPHILFDVVAVERDLLKATHVNLRSNGEEFRLKIKVDRHGEFVELAQKTMYERLFNKPAVTFRISPFKGERF